MLWLRVFAIAVLAVSCAGSCVAADGSARPPADFQMRCEAAMGGHPGGAVVVRVSDGAVLAVVNPEVACRHTHPPGSVFKIVTAYAALREGPAREADEFRCGGQRKTSGVVLHCTVPNGHGSLNLTDALAQSCNVTFYDLGLRLGSAKLLKWAHEFGLDIPYAPYGGQQAVGELPARPVHPADTARLAVGQARGFGITLLEAAGIVRRIACGEDDCSAAVRRGMRRAVTSGTCRNAAIEGLEVAGKTGTPEAPEDDSKRSAWFVGFAPYGKPEVVVVVFAERGHGYDTAAPIAARILSAYFGKGASR